MQGHFYCNILDIPCQALFVNPLVNLEFLLRSQLKQSCTEYALCLQYTVRSALSDLVDNSVFLLEGDEGIIPLMSKKMTNDGEIYPPNPTTSQIQLPRPRPRPHTHIKWKPICVALL
jgi:hypothetical protein